MITLEILKTYSEVNQIQMYDKKDKLGQFYIALRAIISTWEGNTRAGITDTMPSVVKEKALEIASNFIDIHKFDFEKQVTKQLVHIQKQKGEHVYEYEARKKKLESEYHIILEDIRKWCFTTIRSYYVNRMEQMGASKDSLLTTIKDNGELSKVPVFTCDTKTGNIEILVTKIDGSKIVYQKEEEKGEEIITKTYTYKIKRLASPQGNKKYDMPKNVGVFPFFPENLKTDYEQGNKIENLFITEGAFKAFKGSLHGIKIVGLSSITHYRDTNSSKKNPKLHKDIISLIQKCQVSNVVILWDGDCKNISIKDLELENDVTNRPNLFFNSVKNIRDLVKKEKFEHKPKVYFSTIRSNNIDGFPKGIDDLLISTEKRDKKKIEQVIKKIESLENKPNPYFFFCHISNSTSRLNEYFCLDNIDKFYSRHQDLIETREFIFKGDRFVYSEIKNELKMLQPSFLKDVRFIGDNFYQIVDMPTSTKSENLETVKQLTPFKKGTLQDLYGRDFVHYLRDKHYKGFCNIPSHFDYQRDIEFSGTTFYNRYYPFEHTLKEGSCQKTLGLIRHIFQDQYEMGLDYIQLLLNKPIQKLPVIILYSSENATGKSVFCSLLSRIFKNNTVFINNDDLKNEFGLDIFADKLLTICEETLLDRKKDVERIKMITTSTEPISINPKGFSFYKIHTYVKMLFCSNNLRMIHATEHDERFWILHVPQPKEKDVNLLDKMTDEIPAFINYLKNREMHTKEQGRMWFHPDLIKTDILKEVVRVNEHTDVQELRNKLEDYFIDFPNESHLMLSTKDIIEEFMPGKNRAWIDEICANRLGVKKYTNKKGASIIKRSYIMKKAPYLDADQTTKFRDTKTGKTPQRVWVFYRQDFVTEEIEYEERAGEGELTQEIIEQINSEMS